VSSVDLLVVNVEDESLNRC